MTPALRAPGRIMISAPSKHAVCSKRTARSALLSIIFLLIFLPSQSLAASTKAAPPIDILYGAYEIIGRTPGPSGSTYRGWIRIAVDGDSLSVDRCVAGNHSEAEGYLTEVTEDKIPAVGFRFSVNQQPLKAVCAYLNDFDNLPRFSCFTYPRGNVASRVPGLESAFPITWPVPMSYFECG